jgi:NADPH-dependent 2,4-dienoyl-CoA reductase/sulfur reductase-like enzyme
VGAGLAGWRFSEALRRQGFDGKLTLIGEEHHPPYDRPPLSKNVLVGKWDVGHTLLATDDLIASNDVRLLLGTRATSLDAEATTVTLEDGTVVRGTYVVVATGTRARRLSFGAEDEIHTIRTRDDVERLNESLSALAEGSTVAIIGGGFIGAEAATALRTRGFVPIVLEAATRPLVGVLGEDVSLWLEGLAEDAGIELRSRQHITDVTAHDHGFVVSFDDGENLLVEAVIEGAGAVVNTEWLQGSTLSIDNGVVVSKDLMATERIGAIGDVVRFQWDGPLGTEQVRIEHWQVAVDHAAHLAHFLMTGAAPIAPMIPYFWSDQYGKKIQMLGHPRPSDVAQMVRGSLDDAKWLALYSRDGIVTGVVGLSQPRALMLSKILLDTPTTLEVALSLAPWEA